MLPVPKPSRSYWLEALPPRLAALRHVRTPRMAAGQLPRHAAVVVVGGTDAVQGDPLGDCNVSIDGMRHMVQTLLMLGKPTLLLGAGGTRT